jgi:Acetyltransferase (GNAT) domain
MPLTLVHAADAPVAFDRHRAGLAFAGLDDHPFWGGFGRAYYPAVSGERRRDVSFAIVDGDSALLIAHCAIGAGAIDWHGLPIALGPIALGPIAGLAEAATQAALAKAVETIESLAQQHSLDRAVIFDPTSAGTLSLLGAACLGRGWTGALHLNAICDLAQGEPGLNRALRKSFRSLVNWGRKNLTMAYVNAANPDAGEFAAYRDFHQRVAGRSTRPEASWTAMFDWIASGGGELALGRLETGELVAGTMIVDGATTAYYASGVYDRERFDKPMAHFPLYDAIGRSAARGRTTFDIGDIPQTGSASPKELNIGYFKRGFATGIATSIHWTWNRAAATSEVGDSS